MIQVDRVDAFMAWIDNWSSATHPPIFSYFAVEHEGDLALVKGALHLNVVKPNFPEHRSVINDRVHAGAVEIAGGREGLLAFCSDLLTGAFMLESERVIMIAPSERSLTDIVVNVVDDSLPNPLSRPALCKLVGAFHGMQLGPSMTWALRASKVPFDSVDDLAGYFSLGKINDISTIDVIAHQAVWIDDRSVVEGSEAQLTVRVMAGFDWRRARVGYRVISPKGPIVRGNVACTEFEWQEDEGGWLGQFKLAVRPGDNVQAYAVYDDRAQHQWIFGDPTRSQNPRRALLGPRDDRLSKLQMWLDGEGKDPAGDFEAGIAMLGWLLGFSSLWLDRKRGSSETPDVLLACERGFILVECTTAGFGPDKLAKLKSRRGRVRERLRASGQDGLPVLCIVASTVAEADATVEIAACREHQVGFVPREVIAALVLRSTWFPDANALFDEFAAGIARLESERVIE